MPEVKHLLKISDLSISQIENLCHIAESMLLDRASFSDICKGKILATLFFEPSTRTRLSFEAAMLRLGGQVMGFADSSYTSATKGESLADTIRTVSSYADIIAMRNPKEGAAVVASQYALCPIINAGDGGHLHPTQTLTDLLTIRQLCGDFSHLKIGFCGDLKFGRTVHSLLEALSCYKDNYFYFISPPELSLPEYFLHFLETSKNPNYTTALKLEEVIGDIDILYMTRVQRERFFNEQDYVRLKDSYILDMQKMSYAKERMIVMHPLPRVNEIAYEVDNDPRAAYFKQVKYGMYIRMALIAMLTDSL